MLLRIMSTPADRVWQRIHEAAHELSQQKSLPSARHAEAIVWQILREENIEPPPYDVISALAEDLRRTDCPAIGKR